MRKGISRMMRAAVRGAEKPAVRDRVEPAAGRQIQPFLDSRPLGRHPISQGMAGLSDRPARARAARALIAFVCAFAGLTGVTGAAQAATAISAMNGASASQLPPAQLDTQLAAMQAHGVKMVRSDAAWANIEPTPPGPLGHAWVWGATDAWVTALATHHLAWQPILDYSVWWAKNCPGFCAPTSDSTYAAFAQAVAARYGAGGSFWVQHPGLPYYPAGIFEIWNEENVTTFYVSPTRYGSLYSAARSAIHAVDPRATVIIGGLADDSQAFDPSMDTPMWFINRLFTAYPSLVGQVDGFGLHPYGATGNDVKSWVVDFRKGLTSWGEGSAPIYITEVGWTAGTTDAAESWRGNQMATVAAALTHSNCGIAYLAPYTWINPLSLNESADFGLVDRSGLSTVLRSAGGAWFWGVAWAATQPVQNLC